MKAIIDFEQRTINVLDKEITDDHHATLSGRGFAGWRVRPIFEFDAEFEPVYPPSIIHHPMSEFDKAALNRFYKSSPIDIIIDQQIRFDLETQ